MKIRLFLAALALLFIHANALSAQEMALAERRAVKDYQDNVLPALLNNINTAAATQIPVEINWNVIAVAGKAAVFKDPGFWTDIYFVPLELAFKGVASDAMGKQAVKDKVKKIIITFDAQTAPATAYENGVKFENGVLTLNFTPYSNVSDVKDRADAIRKILEAKL